MRCPGCAHHGSKVTKTTRPIDEGAFEFGTLKKRERKCDDCNGRFFTYEIHEDVFRRMLTLTEGKPVRRSLRTKVKPKYRTSHV